MKYTFLISFIFVSKIISAQNLPQQNSADILQSLKKLNTVGSVLYIAAHPDDENTRLLSYLAKEKKLRTGYLSLTRGDGGQNLIGKEQGELLGLIRTQELLAARKIDGAEQFFTRANDFGYSKNPEETFSIWNKDSILADVVLMIRKFKPDVIICRFPTTGEGGHGHHTASAIIASEAFDAAADSTRFRDQLVFTQVWQAKRLVWNTFNFGGTNTTAPNQLKIDVGVFNPLLGKSYGEIASESRSMHKSQGFGTARLRGESIEYFKAIKGDSASSDLFEGIEQTWQRFSTTGVFQKLIDDIIQKFSAQAPEKSVSGLISIYQKLQSFQTKDANMSYWIEQKTRECENLIINCAGLWLEANSSESSVVPGEVVNVNTQVIARNQCNVKLHKINFLNQNDTNVSINLKTNQLYTFKHHEKLSASMPFSNPYWLNEKHQLGLYTENNKQLIGNAENLNAIKVYFQISINDLELKIERPVVYKITDPVKGELYKPFEILPPATINLSEKVFVFNSKSSKVITLKIKANKPQVKGKVEIKVNDGWEVQIKDPNLMLKNKGDEMLVEATITPNEKSKEGLLVATLNLDDNRFSKSITRIEYDHIPFQFMLQEAEAKLVCLDLKMVGKEIGYIPGAGDEVMACLNQIGYKVTVLTDEILSNDNLKKFNAIVTGVRAYNINERLQIHYNKLMSYVQNGGNLIVQYNTNNRIGPVGTKVGPFPFTISRERVTDEFAEVRFNNPQHRVLNYPNKINQNDFDNWVQERGIYFASEIDKNYETIFSINDPKEKANEGSLIIGKYGKGNFVYTGLVFFRELPAGVSGAYRLFANLLSLKANP